jgi:hypothetical protein
MFWTSDGTWMLIYGVALALFTLACLCIPA